MHTEEQLNSLLAEQMRTNLLLQLIAEVLISTLENDVAAVGFGHKLEEIMQPDAVQVTIERTADADTPQQPFDVQDFRESAARSLQARQNILKSLGLID